MNGMNEGSKELDESAGGLMLVLKGVQEKMKVIGHDGKKILTHTLILPSAICRLVSSSKHHLFDI